MIRNLFILGRRAVVLIFLLTGARVGVTAGADPSPSPAASDGSANGFHTPTEGFDYDRRVVMIPMRDGVKLHTVILVPRGARRAPILLTRTPYNAEERGGKEPSSHLAALLGSADVADELVTQEGYIRVLQDVRGKHGSEGDYVMTRPLAGPGNPTPVDHATDAYDTVDWLVRNVPETNGKVGILGISYDGFTSLMALFHPHPALRAAVPINPMVDGWMGDDWFHHGAFRQGSIAYWLWQESTRESSVRWWSDHYDEYTSWLAAGSVDGMARRHGVDRVAFYQKALAHPAYDAFWREQAVDALLAKAGLTVPTMLVHSLWDQEDIFGALRVYRALHGQPSAAGNLFLVLGPWYHHQQRLDGSAIGPIRFGSDTAAQFRHEMLRSFLDHFLKDDPPPLALPAVSAFETGTNRWQKLAAWPAADGAGEVIQASPLRLASEGKLVLGNATDEAAGFDEYVSDPAKPVPFLPRPIHLSGDEGEQEWQTWLVRDGREWASRTDVLSFASEVLTEPLKVCGTPWVHLKASTSGTDGDWVVKLIDVYPDEVGRDPKLGGYQLTVSGDIFRGRYRAGYDAPQRLPAGEPVPYSFDLPDVNHVFLPGHRLMVQVQSSLFPLYDRNPQTFVPNIFLAKPEDYQKATVRIFHGGTGGSYLELPVVKKP